MIIFLALSKILFLSKIFKEFKVKNVLRNKKTISLNKNNLNKWMSLTKKERYNLSRKDSASYLNNRRVLLDQIRKEYKTISEGEENKLDS